MRPGGADAAGTTTHRTDHTDQKLVMSPFRERCPELDQSQPWPQFPLIIMPRHYLKANKYKVWVSLVLQVVMSIGNSYSDSITRLVVSLDPQPWLRSKGLRRGL